MGGGGPLCGFIYRRLPGNAQDESFQVAASFCAGVCSFWIFGRTICVPICIKAAEVDLSEIISYSRNDKEAMLDFRAFKIDSKDLAIEKSVRCQVSRPIIICWR